MSIFNNPDFFPTPEEVAHIMCSKVDIHNKIVLEPSMGKGDLVDVIRQYSPSKIIGCELSEDLLSISSKKVDSVLGADFLSVSKEDVSHIQCIIANPPFSNGDKHALKMWEIAPEGCQVVVILNEETVSNRYNRGRSQLGTIIDTYGYWETLGNVFTTAERKTNVCVAVVVLNKPIVNEENYDQFFDMDEDQDYRYKLSTGYKKTVVRYKEFGTWYDWGFFRVRGYKKGTMHAEFKDEQTWIKFNQTAAKAKGFQLASKFTGDFRAKKQGVEVYA